MRENEIIEMLEIEKSYMDSHAGRSQSEALAYAIEAVKEIQQYRAIGTVEQLEWCKDASHWKELFKEKLEQYEAIGTVEEFKALKEKKNILPIATIKISKEDMQKIVDEKVAQIELDIQGIRSEAIDEFAERLKEKYGCLGYIDEIKFEEVDKIAEQLKAGE